MNALRVSMLHEQLAIAESERRAWACHEGDQADTMLRRWDKRIAELKAAIDAALATHQQGGK